MRALLCLAMTAASQAAPAGQDYKTWKDYGGGPDSSHFVDLKQIDKSNVNQLETAWIYPTGDDRSYVFNPIVVDNVMYVLARNSSLVALDAATGKEIWIHENLPGLATRGIAYWESKDRKDRRLVFAINNHLQEIDARTGKSILTFGNNGLVDLRQGLGRDPETIVRVQPESPGRIFENLILLGSSTGEAYLSAPGHIRAYDVTTGRIVWTFHTIPHPGEEGYDTWPKDAWNTPAAPTHGAKSPWTRSEASHTSPPARLPTTTTAPIASAVTCSPTRCSRWTPAPANGCGISRRFITTCGTTT